MNYNGKFQVNSTIFDKFIDQLNFGDFYDAALR